MYKSHVLYIAQNRQLVEDTHIVKDADTRPSKALASFQHLDAQAAGY